jgi:rare lipoprotein A
MNRAQPRNLIIVAIAASSIILPIQLSIAARAADADAGLSGLAATYRGGRTASGEISPPTGLTAAHRHLPFGTMVRVTNRRNGQTVVVRVNDRGPFTRGRVIDLTPAAAGRLGFSGLTPVDLEVVSASVAGR